MFDSRMLAILGLLGIGAAACAQDYVLDTFEKRQLTDKFYCEGANVADINRDGHMDIVSGPYWYEGPDFTTRHAYYPVEAFDPHNYSHNFLTFIGDFNGDGFPDVLVIGFPGEESVWYENPGKAGGDGTWKRHKALAAVDNESPTFCDLLGNGKPVLVCTSGGRIGYGQPDYANPEKEWTFHPISEKGPWERFTHGLGVGDVNGDHRQDIMLREGWWEQPASLVGDPVWVRHDVDFGGTGGSQMYAVDINGDGRADVVHSLAAHGCGLVWDEQMPDHTFTQHLIMGEKPEENTYGVTFSQMHSLVVADMDGDGLPDIITGKRFWAHGPGGDINPNAPAVLYWFKQVRNHGTIDFIPYQIDDDSGVGTQVVVADINGDHLPDVVVGNKKGTFIFIHHRTKVTRATWEAAQPKPIK